MTETTLALMLDELLPGGEGFPKASAIDLAKHIRQRAEWAEATDTVLAALPQAFPDVPAAERQNMLRRVETDQPHAFNLMLVGAYAGYYIHPAVREVIAQRTGYPARPVQPAGYSLPPFDPAVLDKVRQRPTSYRKA